MNKQSHKQVANYKRRQSPSIENQVNHSTVSTYFRIIMFFSKCTSQAVIRSLLVTSLVLVQVPIVGECANGFPDNVRTTSVDPSSVNTSCYTHVNETYNESTAMTRTRVVRTSSCCTGYSGEHCNITSNSTKPSEQPQATAAVEDPCGNLTCSSYPDAMCAVVSEKTPVFLNSAGVAVDCCNHRPVEELGRTSCGDVCAFDPCFGKTCSQFPDAICLTTPCDRKPLWLLDTGVSVDCSTGEDLLPERTRRQTNSPTQTPIVIHREGHFRI